MEILTKQELADWARSNTRAVDYLVATQQIPFVRWGKRGIRFIKEDVEEHMRKRSGVEYHRCAGSRDGAES